MLHLYIVRHGQTEWNLAGKFQGSQDSPLTELGKQQARQLGERLKGVTWDGIYASPQKRAHETAKLICPEEKEQIILKDDLKEMCFGDWEGRHHENVAKEEPFQWEAFLQSPDTYVSSTGEDYQAVEARVLRALQEIVEKHPAGNVLIISHGIVVKLLMLHFEGRDLVTLWNPPEIRNTSLCKIALSEGQSEILLYSDTSHY